MLDQLPLLIELQKHDIAVDELAAKTSAFDSQIKRKTQEIESLKNNLKTAKDSLTTNTLKKKQLEAEVEEKQKLIQKHNAELNSLKSNDAYKAMLAEINNAKDAVTKIEDQILVVMEAIDAGDKGYKEAERKFKSDESTLKADLARIEGEKAAAAATAAKRKEERDAFAKTLPAAALSQYEAIRAKRGGLAIVPMVRNSCGGCHLSLTPNKANEIKKGKTAMFCDACNRILYLPPETDGAASSSASSTGSSPADKPANVAS